jgi:hypothetical protein
MMYNSNKILFFTLLFCLSVSGVFAQNEWKLRSNNDGIKIYTSPVLNSKVKALKVECNFRATLSQLVNVLMDVKTCTEWVYHTKSITLLKQVSPSELYYYSEVSLPWPAENRDFVAHLTVTQDAQTHVVTVDGPAVPGMVPVKEGIVRILQSKGKWVISPVAKDEVKVEYTLQVDPAGAIPAWLVNLVSSEGPAQSFKALRQQLKKPAYKNTTLAYIKD